MHPAAGAVIFLLSAFVSHGNPANGASSKAVGAENLRHLAGCTAGCSAPRLPGRGMIFGL
jgi:hypothetical protein